jgi:hypothetical protein
MGNNNNFIIFLKLYVASFLADLGEAVLFEGTNDQLDE